MKTSSMVIIWDVDVDADRRDDHYHAHHVHTHGNHQGFGCPILKTRGLPIFVPNITFKYHCKNNVNHRSDDEGEDDDKDDGQGLRCEWR